MIQHEIIPPFSPEWYIYNTITILSITLIILTSRKLSLYKKNQITLTIAGLFIFEFIFMDLYHLYTGVWSIQNSLPLHLCSIMWFITIYMLLTKKQWAFEMMLFIGMPGGVHSLLTPELTHGNSLLHKIDFFIGHGGLVLAPFYAIFVLNMWPRKRTWIITFLKLQILVISVFTINYFVDGNYMYLNHPPIANNPLIPSEDSFLGQWPYYILIFELFVLLHAVMISIPFSIWRKTKSIR